MGQESTINQTNEVKMGSEPTKAYKLDYLGDNVCKIMPHGDQYILMMYTSNMGHASVVVNKSHLLGLADFINKAMEEK
ncbi:MAG: hypothetical protein VKK63_03800 [Synechococcus sp.]|nr:hypothetical protein [Synechococcus sp.]